MVILAIDASLSQLAYHTLWDGQAIYSMVNKICGIMQSLKKFAASMVSTSKMVWFHLVDLTFHLWIEKSFTVSKMETGIL